MAAVSSSKWNTFYNDPVPLDMNEEEVTSAGWYHNAFYMSGILNTVLFVTFEKYILSTYTNGQKKGYTVYMSNYSIVNLKHSSFLT